MKSSGHILTWGRVLRAVDYIGGRLRHMTYVRWDCLPWPLNRDHSSTAPQSVAAESALIDKRRARRRRAFQTLCRGTRAGDWLDCALECVDWPGIRRSSMLRRSALKVPVAFPTFEKLLSAKKVARPPFAQYPPPSDRHDPISPISVPSPRSTHLLDRLYSASDNMYKKM